MTDPVSSKPWTARLLQQEPIFQSPRYQEHRMELELQLQRAEQNERRVYWIVVFAAIVAGAAFLGMASRGFQGADPWDADATILSVAFGIVYFVSASTFMIGLASYYGRFRLATKDVKERLVFESLRELRADIAELRSRLETPRDSGSP